MAVIRCELVVPLAPAGVRIEGDDRISEQVVEIAAHGSIDLRPGITDRPVEQVQRGVVRTRQPHRAATLFPAVAGPGVVPEFAGSGHGIPAPQAAAGGRLVRVEEPAGAEFAAADADDHLVFDDQRRTGDRVAQHRVGDLDFPQRVSRADVQRQQRGIERADEQPLIEHGHSATEGVDLVRILDLLLPHRSPQLPSGGSVERNGCAGLRRVHDAVDDERRGFERRVARHRERPRGLQPLHVARIDLRQRRVVAALIVAPGTSASCAAPGWP